MKDSKLRIKVGQFETTGNYGLVASHGVSFPYLIDLYKFEELGDVLTYYKQYRGLYDNILKATSV